MKDQKEKHFVGGRKQWGIWGDFLEELAPCLGPASENTNLRHKQHYLIKG